MEINRSSNTATRSQAPTRAQAPARRAPRQETPAQRDRASVSAEARQTERPSGQTPSFWSSFGGRAPANRNTSLQYQPDNAQKLQESRVPAELSNHQGGPPAAPESRFRPDELNQDGSPRTGTIFNDTGTTAEGNSRHHYVHVGALEPGMTREQAIAVANGFNAPTSDAMRGYPNSNDTRQGWVDPSAPVGGGLTSGPLSGAGGHVSMNRGTTPDGLPWAINSTTPGAHPLNGHITRSLIEHEGRYYIRTEGIGTGDSGLVSQAQDGLNQLVGPSTFEQLNEAGNRWARYEYGLGTNGQAVADRAWEATQTVARGPWGLLEDAWRGIFG